jgi:hypothetical protein
MAGFVADGSVKGWPRMAKWVEKAMISFLNLPGVPP